MSSFANRVFLAAQSGIKKSQHRKAGGIIGLIPSYLLHRRASLLESGMSGIGIAFRAGDQTLTPLRLEIRCLHKCIGLFPSP